MCVFVIFMYTYILWSQYILIIKTYIKYVGLVMMLLYHNKPKITLCIWFCAAEEMSIPR